MTTLLAEAVVIHSLLGMLLRNVFEIAGNKVLWNIFSSHCWACCLLLIHK